MALADPTRLVVHPIAQPFRRIATRLAAVLVGVTTLPAATLAQVTFQDGDFAPASWSSAIAFTVGGTNSFGTVQQLSGGNPGAYGAVTHFVGSPFSQVFVFHARAGATHDPAVSGPVLGIDFGFDNIRVLDPAQAGGQSATLGIRQGAVVYFGPFSNNGLALWQHTERLDLGASDFTLWQGTAHPDFSSSGAPMQFGLVTSNTNPIGGPPSGYSTTVGYDNWFVTVDNATTGVGPHDAPGTAALRAMPNPFRQQTRMPFVLARGGAVRLAIFDARGRAIRQHTTHGLAAGSHAMTWDGIDDAGRRLPAGAYFYRLKSESWSATGRVTLVE